MANHFRMRVEDARLMAKLRSMQGGLGSDGEKLIKDLSAIGMRAAIKDADSKTDRKTGHLLRSFQLQPIDTRGYGIFGGFVNNASYAEPLNFGFVHNKSGRYIAGRYFMQSGYSAIEVASQNRVRKMLKDILNR